VAPRKPGKDQSVQAQDGLAALKRKLLSHPWLAGLVLLFVVVAAIVSLVNGLFQLSRERKPPVIISLKPAALSYETGEGKTLPLHFEVTAESKDPAVMTDVFLVLQFQQKQASGQFTALNDDDFDGAFRIDETRIRLGQIETRTGQAKVDTAALCRRSGDYKIVATLTKLSEVLSTAEIELFVHRRVIDEISAGAKRDEPVFLVSRTGLVNSGADGFWHWSEFKVLLPQEEARVSAPRAALWFRSDYVGAAGGASFEVYGYYGGYQAIYPARLNGNPYVEFVLRSIRAVPQLVPVGQIGIATPPLIAPVGQGFYRFELKDHDRMSVRNVTAEVCRMVQGTATTVPDVGIASSTHKWSFPSVSLELKAHFDCGATGRNCETELAIGNDTYSVVEHGVGEPSYAQTETDLPLIRKLGPDRYLQISSDDLNSVEVRDCSTR
jgi:hypothetical protein